jgi:hypothetical protein
LDAAPSYSEGEQNRTTESYGFGREESGYDEHETAESARRAETQAARNNVKSSSTHSSALSVVFPASSFSPVSGMRVCGLAA